MLTIDELHELAGGIDELENLAREKKADHIHVSDENYKKEVTIGIYFPGDIKNIHPRVVTLIEKDE